MSEQMILVEVPVNTRVDVEVHPSDIIYALNRQPLTRRWSAVAAIIKHLNLNGEAKDDDTGDKLPNENLSLDQIELIENFLVKHLEYLKQLKNQ